MDSGINMKIFKTFEKFLQDKQKMNQEKVKPIWGIHKEEIEDVFYELYDEFSVPISVKFGIANKTYLDLNYIPDYSSTIDIWDDNRGWNFNTLEKKVNLGEIIPLIRVYIFLTKKFSDDILGDVNYVILSDDEDHDFTGKFKLWKDSVYNLQKNIENSLDNLNLKFIESRGYKMRHRGYKKFDNGFADELSGGDLETGCPIYIIEFLRTK
jgi:hypothetical protein